MGSYRKAVAGVLSMVWAASACLTEASAAEAVRVEPHSEWAEAILYFVVVDRFADGDASNNADVAREGKGSFHGGDLRGLREQLDEIADLGATALWITPVVKNIDGFVSGAGFPDWGYHGYWADDFYSLDPRFGTEEDLKALVDDAHRRGIAVLLDVVYNHPGYESSYTKDKKKKKWLRVEGRGRGCGDDDLTGCLSGLPDFKTEDPEVADYLMDAHLQLAERVGLDGFRLDTVKHVTHEFWREHRRRTRELDEDFFLVGEVWGGDARSLDPWFEGDEMDAGFDFSFQGSSLGFLKGRGRPIAFNRYLEKRTPREGYLLSHFLSNHDTPGALHQLDGDIELFRLAVLLQMTAGGIPQIFYGEEVARQIGDWPQNRSDMPWGARAIEPGAGDPRDEELRGFYKLLIKIRRANPALWRGVHEGLSFGTHTLVFVKKDPKTQPVVVAINRGAESAEVSFKAPEGWAGARIVDLLTGATPTTLGPEIGGASLNVSLPPRSGLILVKEG